MRNRTTWQSQVQQREELDTHLFPSPFPPLLAPCLNASHFLHLPSSRKFFLVSLRLIVPYWKSPSMKGRKEGREKEREKQTVGIVLEHVSGGPWLHLHLNLSEHIYLLCKYNWKSDHFWSLMIHLLPSEQYRTWQKSFWSGSQVACCHFHVGFACVCLYMCVCVIP